MSETSLPALPAAAPQLAAKLLCAECRIPWESPDGVCGKCGRDRCAVGCIPQVDRRFLPTPQRLKPRWSSFSLSTLMLLMTLAAIWLALFSAWPAVALLSLLLFLPAGARTLSAVSVRHQTKGSTTAGEKIGLLIESTGIILLGWIAGFAILGLAAMLFTIAESAAFGSLWFALGMLMMFVLVLPASIMLIPAVLMKTWPQLPGTRDSLVLEPSAETVEPPSRDLSDKPDSFG